MPNASPADTGNPVADFDIEAWRNGRRTPTRVVPVTNDPGAGLRLTQLEEDESTLRAELAAAAQEGRRTPGARAGSKSTPALDSVIAEIREILSGLDGTWTYVHVRALTPHESNRLSDVENRIDRIAGSLAIAATVSPSPDKTVPGVPLDEQGWHDMLDVIGNAQTLKLEAALNELTVAVVTPDFSRRVSSLLDGRTSS